MLTWISLTWDSSRQEFAAGMVGAHGPGKPKWWAEKIQHR